MQDTMSFFHFMNCDTLTELKKICDDDDAETYERAISESLKLIGVEEPEALTQILSDQTNDLIDVFEHLGTSEMLSDVLSWVMAPHSVCRLGVLVCNGSVKEVTRERCDKIAESYMYTLRAIDKPLRFMLTPFRDLDIHAMMTIIQTIDPSHEDDEDDELTLTTILDILEKAPGFFNNGEIRIPFTRGLMRLYKKSFNGASNENTRDYVPSSSQQDTKLVETLKFMYFRSRRLKVISPSYFMTKVEECTYMVAMKQAMLESPEAKVAKTLHLINYRWRIVDGLSASGGDPIHLYDLTYFYDILQAEEEFTADRQILKDIIMANQEVDAIKRTDIMKRFKPIYDSIDTVIDLL